ncbi:heavy metal translocating P-type ATPase [Aquirufa sp. ROCK2-A2]
MNSILIEKVKESCICYHCGEECHDEIIQLEEKKFCCSGCQKVYQLLNENSLNDYYECDIQPGLSPSLKNFDYLNKSEFRDRLISFSNQNLSKVNFILPAIHCRSCLYLLENLHKLQEGIIKTQLNFGKKDLTVWFHEEEISLGALANLLAKIGYEPFISNQEDNNLKKRRNSQEIQFLIKLGIAGFCAGNSMLFSFPEYLGIENGSFKQVFGYLNLVLGSFSLFYAGSDYFRNVWSHLKIRKITIELPILLGLIVGYSRSVYEVISQTGAGYIDSVSGLLFFLLIGKWFQQKSFDFLSFERNYKSYFPLVITKLATNGREENAPLEKIQIGDHLIIRNQEIIPADALLIKGKSKIDYSFVTGESELVAIEVGSPIYAGGKHQGESIEIVIKNDLKHSHLTQLWEQQAFKDPIYKTENWENFANQVGVYFTLLLLSLAASVATYWIIVDPSKWANAMVSILIIACPCALAISYPFALGHGIRWLSQFHFFVKDIQAFERMAQVDTLVFDKTGTLTLQDNLPPHLHLIRDVQPLEWDSLYSLAKQSTHPLSRQFCKYLFEKGSKNQMTISAFQEIPGKGLEARIGNQFYKIGSYKYAGNPFIQKKEDFYSSETQLFFQINGENIGYIEFPWRNRKGVEGMLHQLQRNYDIYLISGDKAFHSDSLSDWFPDKSKTKFECSPLEKMQFIQGLQNQGKRVAMIGDGLNDAGALQQANVGIAVSDDHLHFTPASDGILRGSEISHLPDFLAFSRYGVQLIKASFVVSVIYNIIGLSFAVQGNLSPLIAAILMPVNSISMLIIATVGMNWKGKKLKAWINQLRT